MEFELDVKACHRKKRLTHNGFHFGLMTTKEIIKLFENISVWKRASERAPHKPLLLLMALANCQRRGKRLIPFAEIDGTLRRLLVDFGPYRKSYHTEYPFWRLKNDGIWQLERAELVQTRKSNTDAKKANSISITCLEV